MRLNALTAEIEGGTWRCAEQPEFARALNIMKPTAVLSAAFPNRDLALAQHAAYVLGGEVLDVPEPEEVVPNRLY